MASARKYLIAGNWKMNVPSSDAGPLVSELVDEIRNVQKVDVLLCPPFTSIQVAKSAIGPCNILVGAQNFFPEKDGAFTGEISAVMLRDLGVSHVIIGHSERRIHFGEDDNLINRKVKFALSNNLIPILCVGEAIDQRKVGRAFDVVQKQIEGALRGVLAAESHRLVVAYEPVWAIGTGETATPETAQEMHVFIRRLLLELFGADASKSVKILYGGSMKPDNVRELLGEDDIDGGLIGGASLKARSFAEIVKIAGEISP
ncbi:MAG: triose-phosphate isomerase [Puniceicoccales bacterium]|jgi:triosephosphate isomerase|nr:triose-phosphate isomerase [Puniceicoccales bacterium]